MFILQSNRWYTSFFRILWQREWYMVIFFYLVEPNWFFIVDSPTRNSEKDILFGLPNETDNQIILNFCILHMQNYIHEQRLFLNNNLVLEEFKRILLFKIEIEKKYWSNKISFHSTLNIILCMKTARRTICIIVYAFLTINKTNTFTPAHTNALMWWLVREN